MSEQSSLPSEQSSLLSNSKSFKELKARMNGPRLVKVDKPQYTKKRTAKKSDTWCAWTGTPGELRKINQRFEDLVRARRDELLNGVTDEDYRNYRSYISRELQPETTIATQNDETVSGGFEDVIDELNPQTWATVALRAGGQFSDENLCLEFRRKPNADGSVVELTVKSADPGMAASSLSRLSELVVLGKPRWAWLHKKSMPGLMFSLAWIIVVCSVAVVLSKRWSIDFASVPSPTLLVVALMLGVGVPLAATSGKRLMRRVLPPAEIRYDHIPQSSGSRFIASLIALWVIPIIVAILLAFVL